MQIKTQELNGFFQIHQHTSSARFLWLIFVSISLFFVACGAWISKANVFVFSQDTASKYFEITLALCIFLVVPGFIILYGVAKIYQKTGVYLRGVRVANKGVEIGTLTLGVTSVPAEAIWRDELFNTDVPGEWQSTNELNENEINILIIHRKRRDMPNRFFLDRIVFSSRDKHLFQLSGFDMYLTKSNDIVAISQGAVYFLGNHEGLCPEDFFSFCEKTTNIISRWQPSFALTCTLKTMPSLANLNNVLAVGMLGGVDTTSAKNINDSGSEESIFDSLNDKRILR